MGIKFDAKPSQAQKIFAFYVKKISKIPASIQTAQQKALLEKPESQAVLEGSSVEQVKDEETATCIIEILAVKNIEEDTGEESKMAKMNKEPRLHAVSISPTETSLQRSLTLKEITFRTSKPGKRSLTHG